MRIANLLKSILVTILVAMPTLGFSTDRSNNDTEPEVRLLPTKIIRVSKGLGDELTDVYRLKYNSKNRLVKVIENEERDSRPIVHTYKYDTYGRLTRYIFNASAFEIAVYTYVYNDAEETVTLFIDDRREHLVRINKDGLPVDNIIKIDKDGSPVDDEISVDSRLKKSTYQYDKDKNLLKQADYIEEKIGDEMGTMQDITNITYTTVYNMCLNTGLPGWWFMFTNVPYIHIPLQSTTGMHTPSKYVSATSFIIEGQRMHESIDVSTISVLEERNNYPTKLKTVFEEIQKGKVLYTTTATITVEYKKIKHSKF